MTHDDVQLVFIGGAPRSGTTLVRRMLNAHPDVYAGPEFDILPELIRVRDLARDKVRIGRIDAIVDEAGVDAAFAGAIQTMLAPRARRDGARVYAEKTPSNVGVFPQLLEMFPEARCILVLRDPRAVAASMKEVHRRYREAGDRPPVFIRDVHASVREINRLLTLGFAALSAHPDRVLALHYEDLVDDPAAGAQRICAFLGLPFSTRMLEVEKQSHDRPKVAEVSRWYSDQDFNRPIEATRREAWGQVLTPAEAGVVAAGVLPHPLLERYALGSQPVTWGVRGHWVLNALRQTMRRVGRAVARRIPQ